MIKMLSNNIVIEEEINSDGTKKITASAIISTATTEINIKNPVKNHLYASIFYSPVKFTGTAVYKPGDKDDKVTAIRIATGKLERQYYRYVYRSIRDYINEFQNTITIYSDEMDKCDKLVDNCTDHIIELAESTNSD